MLALAKKYCAATYCMQSAVLTMIVLIVCYIHCYLGGQYVKGCVTHTQLSGQETHRTAGQCGTGLYITLEH